MGTMDNVNIALTEALHKTVKAAFRHSNKVNLFPQMCFWDDWQLSVEMREATLKYQAVDQQGFWSSKIQGAFELLGKVRRVLPLLAGLKPYMLLGILKREL